MDELIRRVKLLIFDFFNWRSIEVNSFYAQQKSNWWLSSKELYILVAKQLNGQYHRAIFLAVLCMTKFE